MIRASRYKGFDFLDLLIGLSGWFALYRLDDLFSLVGLRAGTATQSILANALVILVVVGLVVARRVIASRPPASGFAQARAAFGLSHLANTNGYKKDLWLGFAMLGLSAVALGLASRLGWDTTYTGANILSGSLLQIAVAAILVATITPVVEELLFRGLLFRALQQTIRVRHAFLFSACVSGVLFAVGHGLPNDPKFYSSLATGIAAAYAYRRSDSLLSPYIVHVVANGFGALLILLAVLTAAVAG